MKQKPVKLKQIITCVLIALLLLSAVFLIRGYLKGYFDSVESFQEYIGRFGVFAAFILTAIQALQVVVPVLPGFLGCIVGAGMFGAPIGFICNYIGISAGSIIAFWLARKFGVELVRQLISMEKYDKFVAWLNKRKSYDVVLSLAILLPLAPDDFLCYFSGLTGMSAKKFTWIIIIFKPWCILAYCFFSAYFI